jgi:hypothetical protein
VWESNGQLVGNINPGAGTPPFLWQLVAPSPVTTAPQASSTFTGLPAGNYAMRVTDACGTISTDAFILQNPDTQFGFYLTAIGQQGGIIAEKIGCDSMQVTYWLGISNPRMPLTFEYHTSNGIFIPTSGTTIDSSNLHDNGAVMVRQIIPGMDYGDQVQAYIYNSCGDSAVSMSIVTHPFIFYPKYSFNDCGNTANVAFTNTPYYEYHTSINTEANYTLTHVSTNTVVESGTIIEQLNQNNGYISIIPPVIPGEPITFLLQMVAEKLFRAILQFLALLHRLSFGNSLLLVLALTLLSEPIGSIPRALGQVQNSSYFRGLQLWEAQSPDLHTPILIPIPILLGSTVTGSFWETFPSALINTKSSMTAEMNFFHP